MKSMDDMGSAVAEFVMVVGLLLVLTLSVIQLALVLHIRNTIIDAAAEGARCASLADSSLSEGRTRTVELITSAIGADYARQVRASAGNFLGHAAVTITVLAPVPVLGLIGIDGGLEVSGHAALEEVG